MKVKPCCIVLSMQRKQDFEIAFSPQFQPDDQTKKAIRAWPPLGKRIEEWQRKGFGLKELVVLGAWKPGTEILGVHARAFYVDHSGKSASYHFTILPDAATLLTVFKVAAEEVATGEAGFKHHVVLIKQTRAATGNAAAFEIPAGLVKIQETAEEAALRESREEALGFLQKETADASLSPLGEPLVLHPAVADRLYPFVQEITLSPEGFADIRRALHHGGAGNEAETERISVHVLELDHTLRITREGPYPQTHMMLSRYKSGLYAASRRIPK